VARALDCETCRHLHSDTYWRPDRIGFLLDEIAARSRYTFAGDLSFSKEQSFRRSYGTSPPWVHFQPEESHFNLSACEACGFGFGFSRIREEDSGFAPHNFGSIEALIGQYAVSCLTGLLRAGHRGQPVAM
jgi:hypothetical protein